MMKPAATAQRRSTASRNSDQVPAAGCRSPSARRPARRRRRRRTGRRKSACCGCGSVPGRARRRRSRPTAGGTRAGRARRPATTTQATTPREQQGQLLAIDDGHGHAEEQQRDELRPPGIDGGPRARSTVPTARPRSRPSGPSRPAAALPIPHVEPAEHQQGEDDQQDGGGAGQRALQRALRQIGLVFQLQQLDCRRPAARRAWPAVARRVGDHGRHDHGGALSWSVAACLRPS